MDTLSFIITIEEAHEEIRRRVNFNAGDVFNVIDRSGKGHISP